MRAGGRRAGGGEAAAAAAAAAAVAAVASMHRPGCPYIIEYEYITFICRQPDDSAAYRLAPPYN